MSPHPRAPRGRDAGFSLVEVLVSMCVVAVGILALAALTQATTRHDKANELRAIATLLAVDLADRLRANAAGVAGYAHASAAWPAPVAPPHAGCTRSRPCAPADLAQADLADWTSRLRAALPAGSGWVATHAATARAGESADVWVGWRDPATLPVGAATERAASECPPAWSAAAPTVRCVYLQVGL